MGGQTRIEVHPALRVYAEHLRTLTRVPRAYGAICTPTQDQKMILVYVAKETPKAVKVKICSSGKIFWVAKSQVKLSPYGTRRECVFPNWLANKMGL